jgi:hypothetical protein
MSELNKPLEETVNTCYQKPESEFKAEFFASLEGNPFLERFLKKTAYYILTTRKAIKDSQPSWYRELGL